MTKKEISGNSNKFYAVMYTVLAKFFRVIFRIEIINPENEPKDCGGMIVCSNHISLFDVIVIAASMNHQICYLAKAELFQIPLLGGLIRAFGAFPIKRGSADVGAIKNIIELVGEGKTVGVFAQGTRYKGRMPKLEDVKPGIGMVTARSRATVLPIAVVTKNFRVRPFCKTKIVIGKPIEYAELSVSERTDESGRMKVSVSEYKRISEQIFEHVITLASENRFDDARGQ